jgi:hypothetical protein
LGEDSSQFGLPAGLFFAGKFGEICQGLVDGGIEGPELGEEFVADAIAGVGGVRVGGVFPPGLIAGVEEGFNLGAASREQGAKDFGGSAGKVDLHDGMDGGEALGPGSTE